MRIRFIFASLKLDVVVVRILVYHTPLMSASTRFPEEKQGASTVLPRNGAGALLPADGHPTTTSAAYRGEHCWEPQLDRRLPLPGPPAGNSSLLPGPVTGQQLGE